MNVSFKFKLGTLHSVVSTYLELPLCPSFKVSDHIIRLKFGRVQSWFDKFKYKLYLANHNSRRYWSLVKVSMTFTWILPCTSFRSYAHNQPWFPSSSLSIDTEMSDIMAIPTITTDHVACTKLWSSYKRSTVSDRKGLRLRGKLWSDPPAGLEQASDRDAPHDPAQGRGARTPSRSIAQSAG